jgi:hypothetical protein
LGVFNWNLKNYLLFWILVVFLVLFDDIFI